jgi:FkbM family methyltransferase
MKTTTRPPLLFRLAKRLIRHELRGGHRIIEVAQKLRAWDVEVRYQLDDRFTIDVPIYREATPWDARDVLDYERDHVEFLAAAAARLPRPVLFLDCGADIGTFSVLLARKCAAIDRIIAFEPNRTAFQVCETNIARLPVSGEVKNVAVSDFVGKGELVAPAHDKSEHAFYLVPSPSGTIPVTRLDELDVRWEDTSVVVKLDVEGNEMKALRGAESALRRAKGFAVSLEANPRVQERTGEDPLECVRYLRDVRRCKATVSEEPGVEIDLGRGFFDQVRGRVYNVVCESSA